MCCRRHKRKPICLSTKKKDGDVLMSDILSLSGKGNSVKNPGRGGGGGFGPHLSVLLVPRNSLRRPGCPSVALGLVGAPVGLGGLGVRHPKSEARVEEMRQMAHLALRAFWPKSHGWNACGAKPMGSHFGGFRGTTSC